MRRIEIAPTKSSLRRIRSDLEFAYEGFDLLNQKREILVIEIVRTIKSIREVEAGLKTAMDDLYMKYKVAAAESGSETLAMKSLSEKTMDSLEIEYGRLMGITIPSYNVKHASLAVSSSLAGTGASYDMIKTQSADILRLLVNYASLAKKVFLLSSELKKVQRRVNALEKIFIPAYEETKKYITDRLEEMDREEIFIKKLIGRGRE